MNTYGFDQEALELIYRYLRDRSQKVKVGSSFRNELDVLCGVSQVSILGPPLFNIDICDLFFIDMSSDIANYADDTTPFECVRYYDKLKENLELTIYKISNLLKYNNFKINATLYQSANLNNHDSIIKSTPFFYEFFFFFA